MSWSVLSRGQHHIYLAELGAYSSTVVVLRLTLQFSHRERMA